MHPCEVISFFLKSLICRRISKMCPISKKEKGNNFKGLKNSDSAPLGNCWD